MAEPYSGQIRQLFTQKLNQSAYSNSKARETYENPICAS